jgi:hypothetical protein
VPVLALLLITLAPGFAEAELPGTMPAAARLDLSNAVIVAPPDLSGAEQKAVTVLAEEMRKRTGITLEVKTQWPDAPTPVIAVGLRSQISQFAGGLTADLVKSMQPGAEGFILITIRQPRPAVLIVGADARGLLYGIGRFLRNLDWAPKAASIAADLHLESSPKYPLRGDQLGYRPKVNAYDAWSEAQFDQYIRELALFGANSIELLPPRTDDQRTSPLMKLPPIDMMERLSKIIDSYGLDVWIWYPNMGKDYTSEPAIAAELAEREEIFRRLKRIDHILVPGGDPGNLAPEIMFPWLDRVAALLHKYHPNAKIWLSPQGFSDPARFESFVKLVNQKPQWLGGVVYGPWIPVSMPRLRELIDKDIKFRNYPDITHNVVCQYPVPNWDIALALTLHRECYNPRPLAMKIIHNKYAEYSIGSLCYSEGINDDVNKFIWLDQDWDPSTPAVDTLRDYARLFINPRFSDAIAQGYLAEERNWVGPLAGNEQINITLRQWQELESQLSASRGIPSPGTPGEGQGGGFVENATTQKPPPQPSPGRPGEGEKPPKASVGGGWARESYRFEMGLLRANYDAYIQRRLIHETELEASAMDVLRTESAAGSFAVLQKAEAILNRARTQPVAVDLKHACEVLADSLFEKIGSQLTVQKHGGQNRTRGAFMDGIDEPLNNANWLRAQFRLVCDLPDEPARLAAIQRILHRTDPGPGGFYDSLGSPQSEHRIVNSLPWEDDPGNQQSPRTDFPYNLDLPQHRDVPLAWRRQKLPLFANPLRIAYDNLDPAASYLLRTTYCGEFGRPSSLIANGKVVIHRKVGNAPTQEFQIPHQATAGGRLELEWKGGGVSEVWLIRQDDAEGRIRDARPNADE